MSPPNSLGQKKLLQFVKMCEEGLMFQWGFRNCSNSNEVKGRGEREGGGYDYRTFF